MMGGSCDSFELSVLTFNSVANCPLWWYQVLEFTHEINQWNAIRQQADGTSTHTQTSGLMSRAERFKRAITKALV